MCPGASPHTIITEPEYFNKKARVPQLGLDAAKNKYLKKKNTFQTLTNVLRKNCSQLRRPLYIGSPWKVTYTSKRSELNLNSDIEQDQGSHLKLPKSQFLNLVWEVTPTYQSQWTLRTLKNNSSGEVKSLSHVQLFATPWTVAYQGPLSMG